jgi:hypothetical protein
MRAIALAVTGLETAAETKDKTKAKAPANLTSKIAK